MESRIEAYVDGVFSTVPKTEHAKSVISEIVTNLTDKFNDLSSQGMSDEQAYAAAISSGGDLSGIAADLRAEAANASYTYEKTATGKSAKKQLKRENRKCARFSSCLWPATVCVYLVFSFFVHGSWAYSWIIFLLAAAANSLFCYFTMKSSPKKRKGSMGSFIWTLITAVYFIVSFATMRWDITWLIFILGASVSGIAHAIMNKDKYDDDDDDDDGDD